MHARKLVVEITAGVALAALLAVGYGYYMQRTHGIPGFTDGSQRTVTAGGVPVQAEVVSTDASRQKGLSGRSELAPGTAMLFVFDTDGMWGFWMKDMSFAIDIVWVAPDGTVVGVAPSAAPDTYPHIFYPAALARFVLELPAGFSAAHELAVGGKIVI